MLLFAVLEYCKIWIVEGDDGLFVKGKGKVIPLQARCGPEGV